MKMKKNIIKIIEEIKKEIYFPVYILQGKELFYIKIISNYIKNSIEKKEENSNTEIYYGGEKKIKEIIEQAKKILLTNEKKIIILKEAEKNEELGKKKGKEALMKYINNPEHKTILIIEYNYKKIDIKIKKNYFIFNAEKINNNEISEWINEYVIINNLKIKKESINLIKNLTGSKLENLSKEIEKIKINMKKNDIINNKIIKKYISENKEYNINEFQDIITKKSKPEIIKKFIKSKNDIIEIINFIFNFFYKILIIRNTSKAAEKYSLKQIINNINYIYQAELQNKGIKSNFKKKKILTELIFKMIKS